MLAVIALLVTCLVAGTSATKASSGEIKYGHRGGYILPKSVVLAPRRRIGSHIIIRQPALTRRVSRRRILPRPVIRRGYGYKSDYVDSGYGYEDDSYKTIGALAGQAAHGNSYETLGGSSYIVPNQRSVPAVGGYKVAVGNPRLGYINEGIPLKIAGDY